MNRIAPAIAACLLAAACSELPVDTSPPEDTHVVCNSDSLGWTIGKTADATLIKRAQLEATAKYVRTLRPGQVVTMEYSDQRLNLHVNEKNIVTSYSCG